MIETERLRLRAWQDRDRPRFAAVLNTAAVTRHLGGLADESTVDALFRKRLDDQQAYGCCYWAVELRETGELIGSCGLRIAHDYPETPVSGMVEAGWRIGDAHWHKGYAREAMFGAIDWGWRRLDSDCIGTWTIAENAPSLALMRSLGFEPRPDLDFVRPGTGERCLVHILPNPKRPARGHHG